MEVKFLVIMEISLLLSNCSLEKICSITFSVDYKENPATDLSAVDITILLKTLRTWYGRVLPKYCCCGSVSKLCTTLWDTTNWSTQASLSFTVSRVYTDSCPLSQWCHPTIASSVALFSFCLHSFPASGSFPVSWLFTSGS